MLSRLKNIYENNFREIRHLLYRPQRILFDHLPKCAGFTVNSYLARHYPRRVIFLTNTRNPSESVMDFQKLPEDSRHGYQLIIGHLTHELLDYIHPDTITLTILRDPVDRIVSHYFYVRQDKENYLHERVIQSDIQLKEYVSLGLSSELRNWYTTHFTGLSVEQAEMNPEDSVNLAVNIVLEKYKIIGFQNDLLATINKLRRAANLHLPFDNQMQNKTIDRPSLEEISEESKRIIAEANFLDVQFFKMLQARVN